LDGSCWDKVAAHFVMLENVMQRAHDFDVLHFHCDYLHFPFSRHSEVPHLTTLHGRLDIPEVVVLHQTFQGVPLVSISMSQRRPLPRANWVGNIYHGLPKPVSPPGTGKKNYLAFVGRIAREKRVDRAIQIAIASGMQLKIAAKVDPADRDYYEKEIKPLLNCPAVEYIGEISEQQKPEFLGDAYAQIFPIDWPEPFGLCMIEAMAYGTPTIAFDCGSVREVLKDGVTGFVVDSVEQAVAAVPKVANLSRAGCRREFEKRFLASRMAEDYARVYESLVGSESVSLSVDRLDSSLAL
jgi:glycosyltransferase involved in cell wall biosynthesis